MLVRLNSGRSLLKPPTHPPMREAPARQSRILHQHLKTKALSSDAR